MARCAPAACIRRSSSQRGCGHDGWVSVPPGSRRGDKPVSVSAGTNSEPNQDVISGGLYCADEFQQTEREGLRMNILVKGGIAAALVAAGAGLARADVVTTTGGIKVVSSNGDFSAAVGTLVQFDAYADENDSGSKVGSGTANGSSNDAFRFRRVWITLAGKVYSFHYHVDYDTVTGAL